MNIFDFAIKMEQDGKIYYEKLAKDATLPGLQTIFARLAEDEQKHYDTFVALRDGGKNFAMADSTVLEFSKNVFAALPKESGEAVKDDLDSYRHAMQLEAESFRLYESAAKSEEEEGPKRLLLKIAAEEHKHFQILENIYSFANAPNQYLAWGEFSNLDEFRNFGRKIDR
ncbi:MAG: ferritin [Deltaproteobacteria bacterium HGW-Deltaproteobacteria-4]|nr:MAG: ferritin [Deltaproteobacteria bacterium HGW-Deltaproteobacteria-4]